MKVTINGKEFEYTSDFDPVQVHENVSRNWMVSAGDYFKYPVQIGNTNCFVKRFNKKSTEISGYDFLVRVKGQQLRGLPVVYDVVHVKESDKQVIYLFTEYIGGQTLDSLQRKGFSFLPSKLGEDIFHGLKSIHEKGFWFPDFDPKNFIRSEKGDTYVIDLDSTYPISAPPANSMFGSKDFWAPVYEYYRKNGKFSIEEMKKIKGDVLNNVSLAYLLGLYSYYLDDKAEDLTAHSIVSLNDYLLQKHKLFTSTLMYCCSKDGKTGNLQQRPLTADILLNLVKVGLFPDNAIRVITASPGQPVIHSFTANGKTGSALEIKPGEPVMLQWSASNTTSLKLLPGNILLPNNGTLKLLPAEDTLYRLEAGYKYKSETKKIIRSVDVSIYDPFLTRPLIEFSTEGNKTDALFLLNTNYTVRWKVNNAAKVYLDGAEVNNANSRQFTASKNTTHVLKAVNAQNGTTKKAEATVVIRVENKPGIQFNLSTTEIRSGQPVTLTWNVTHGKNISILQDGKTISSGCSQTGSLKLQPDVNIHESLPKRIKYAIVAHSNSGLFSTRTEPELVLTVMKKAPSYKWVVWIFLLLIALLAVYLIAKANSNNEGAYEYEEKSDTTAVAPYYTDSAVDIPAETNGSPIYMDSTIKK